MSPISVKLVLVARHWEVVDPARDGLPASSRLVYSGPRDLGCVRGVVPLQPDLRVWDLLGSRVRLLSCQYRFAALAQILYRSLWMSLWLSLDRWDTGCPTCSHPSPTGVSHGFHPRGQVLAALDLGGSANKSSGSYQMGW